jgi:hypothetical protein
VRALLRTHPACHPCVLMHMLFTPEYSCISHVPKHSSIHSQAHTPALLMCSNTHTHTHTNPRRRASTQILSSCLPRSLTYSPRCHTRAMCPEMIFKPVWRVVCCERIYTCVCRSPAWIWAYKPPSAISSIVLSHSKRTSSAGPSPHHFRMHVHPDICMHVQQPVYRLNHYFAQIERCLCMLIERCLMPVASRPHPCSHRRSWKDCAPGRIFVCNIHPQYIHHTRVVEPQGPPLPLTHALACTRLVHVRRLSCYELFRRAVLSTHTRSTSFTLATMYDLDLHCASTQMQGCKHSKQYRH